MLERPYVDCAPKGRGCDFSWGSLAVLEDAVASNENIFATSTELLAWVGELVGGMPDALRHSMIQRLSQLLRSGGEPDDCLADDPVFQQLNGAFAILFANEMGFSVVTDPLGATQVFWAGRHDGGPVCAGTHADLVAGVGGVAGEVDRTSVAQFLSMGHCTYPHTMYKHLIECQPGAVHMMRRTENGSRSSRLRSYWSLPPEMRTGYNEADLADTLQAVLLTSVADRCGKRKTGVALSGGLDSRLVIAAIPDDKDCVALTMCDTLNREARTAQRVATAYGRSWVPLFRWEEYLADQLEDVVRFVGCECEFVHAHMFGFADAIGGDVDVLLTGDLLDTLLRACTAKDFNYRHRWGGLLPRRYGRVPFDGLRFPADLWEEQFVQRVLGAMAGRLKDFQENHADSGRGSAAESLKIYPFRQWVEVAVWSAHRRRLPIRLVGADRRLLDLAFRCPVELKLGDRVFLKAARQIFGPGLRIPSANDGVQPCSGHLWRLVQRAKRKSEDRLVRISEYFGRKAPIQHSWHDYPAYWRQSKKLAMLRREYGPHLNRLDGVLFKHSGQALLEDESLSWEHGLRLLQLAVWLGQSKQYRSMYNGRH